MRESAVLPQRNNGLDFFRLICIFLVLCIHIPFQNTAGMLGQNIGRIAVPFFFMLTGYYYRSVAERGKLKKQIGKTVKILLLSLAVCGLYGLIISCSDPEIHRILLSCFTWPKIRELLFFNNIDFPFCWHLWYLSALLYVLILVYPVSRLLLKKPFRIGCYLMSIFFLAAALLLGKYSFIHTMDYIPVCYGRNFLLTGFPFFMAGIACDHLDDRKTSGTRLLLSLAFTAFFVWLTVKESFWYSANLPYKSGDLLLTTLFLTVSLFYTGLILGRQFSDSRILKRLAETGRKYAFPVFVLHVPVMNILQKNFHGENLFSVVLREYGPITVLLCTMCIWFVLSFLMNSICRRKSQ